MSIYSPDVRDTRQPPASLLTLTKIRELTLSAAAGPGQPLYLSAASGLVHAGPCLYVVADDELHLGAFGASDARPGELIRLLPGELPALTAQRKPLKPDLETLMRLPRFSGYPDGALFALGSGSKRNRRLGALLALDAGGAASGAPRVIDLEKMFDRLADLFEGLNIEGGVVSATHLRLLQRGNKRDGGNALILFELAPLLAELAASAGIVRQPPSAVQPVMLGEIDGIPLGFTDGAALGDGTIVFSAVAENTADNYNDGPCAGAAVGILDPAGKLRCLHRLDQPHKIEGIDAQVKDGVIQLLLVTDADDRRVPAGLFSARLNIAPGNAPAASMQNSR